MALELKSTVESAEGCIGFIFNDTTGIYNADTNPGGYNDPNPVSSIVNGSRIKIYPPNSTIPYELRFTIETGNIASVTLIAPDGTETDVTSDFTDYSFPFEDMVISETYFGFEEDESVNDGVWTFLYSIATEDSQSFNTTTYVLVKCTACCCISKMYLNIANCSCDDKIESAQTADAYLKAAVYAANLGMMEEAQRSIDKANEVCNGNCADCN